MCKARRVPMGEPGAADGAIRDRSNRTRVALDATPLLGTVTGVGVFCRDAMRALASRGDLEVGAFAVTWRRRGWLQVPSGVRAFTRPMPARPLHAAWRQAGFPPIEWFVGETDVVHGTNFVVPPSRGAARVVTVHDLTPLKFPELCDGATLAFPAMLRRAIAEGAWVHTPSSYVAGEVVAELGADPERVRAVHHGVPGALGPERQVRRPRPPDVPVRLPPGTSRYVLAIGTIELRKDYPGLVRAFDMVAGMHPDVALVIAGPEGWGAAALASALDGSKHAERVVRCGYVRDVEPLLSGAALLAYPSLYEGFGFPPLQAMAAGVPVVATAAGAVEEVAGDAAVLVEPGDAEALAASISGVLDDELRRAELISRGKARIAGLTWEACAEGLAALYRDAASAR